MTASSTTVAPLVCVCCGVRMFGSYTYLYFGPGTVASGPLCPPCVARNLQAKGLDIEWFGSPDPTVTNP